MSKEELASVDLNLLVALRALLTEQHVTRAARRVGLSQPAMSRALGRLRELLQDELLVRAQAGLQRTARAEALLPALESVLEQTQALITPAAFDPARAKLCVRIAVPEIVAYMLLPQVVRRLARQAPQVDLHVVAWSPRWREHLESGEVDLTIGAPRGDEPSIFARTILRNEWATVLRRGHPALEGPWSAERFAELEHTIVSFDGQGAGQVDEALAVLGLRRRVAVRQPYTLLSVLLVEETDLVLSTARWLAERLSENHHLVVRPTPVALQPVELPLVWHERSHRDPRQAWIRSVLFEEAQRLSAAPSR